MDGRSNVRLHDLVLLTFPAAPPMTRFWSNKISTAETCCRSISAEDPYVAQRRYPTVSGYWIFRHVRRCHAPMVNRGRGMAASMIGLHTRLYPLQTVQRWQDHTCCYNSLDANMCTGYNVGCKACPLRRTGGILI